MLGSVTLDGSSTTPGLPQRRSTLCPYTTLFRCPSVSVPGTYTLTVTNPANGCSKTDQASVRQDVIQPLVSAGAEERQSTRMNTRNMEGRTTTPGVNYSWSGPGGFSSASASPSVS